LRIKNRLGTPPTRPGKRRTVGVACPPRAAQPRWREGHSTLAAPGLRPSRGWKKGRPSRDTQRAGPARVAGRQPKPRSGEGRLRWDCWSPAQAGIQGAQAGIGPAIASAGRDWPGSAQKLCMPARRGQIRCMPAHRREFRSENIYAGQGNARVDPGPTYVGRDINMPARGS
jgi:hypothetical protein